MIADLMHDLKIEPTRDESARQEFVSSLRGYMLVDMASSMSRRYEEEVAPQFEREHKRLPKEGSEVHRAMKAHPYFKYYSSVRYNAQEMVWRSVIPVVEKNREALTDRTRQLQAEPETGSGSLELNGQLKVPKNVSAIDVHLSPGSYHSEYGDEDIAAGAIYDNGLNIFAANLMGRNLDDIGQSMSNYIRLKYPSFEPQKILDLGCTVGHNSAAWAKTFPEAEVHAIDVSAPLLRYGSARAKSQSVPVHFKQMNATDLQYQDGSFDVVFSSMFQHELPLKDIRASMAAAYRVLKPGGLMLHMELPPNDQMKPYDSFYLDWDSYYNQEPYYKCFRDQNYQALCENAGFEPCNYLQFAVPQFTYMDEDDFKKAIGVNDDSSGQSENLKDVDDKVGRLTDGISWFGFGAWK